MDDKDWTKSAALETASPASCRAYNVLYYNVNWIELISGFWRVIWQRKAGDIYFAGKFAVKFPVKFAYT